MEKLQPRAVFEMLQPVEEEVQMDEPVPGSSNDQCLQVPERLMVSVSVCH